MPVSDNDNVFLDYLMFEPFSNRGKARIENVKKHIPEFSVDITTFFRDFYIKPKSEILVSPNPLSSDTIPNEFEESNPVKPTGNETLDQLIKGIKQNDLSFFIIKGWAGSGKTTFIQKLVHDIGQGNDSDNYSFTTLDFSNSDTSPFVLDGLQLSFGNKSGVEDSILRLLSSGIIVGLGREEDNREDPELYLERLSQYITIHREYFHTRTGNNPPQADGIFDFFFNRLKNEIDSTTKINATSFPERVSSTIGSFLRDTLLYENYKGDFAGYETEKPRIMVGLVSRLLFCRSMIDNRKYYIVIDNIEQYIRESDLKERTVGQNDLISVFRLVLEQLRLDNNKLSEKIAKNEKHPYFGYGFIVGCRQTTCSITGKNHHDNHRQGEYSLISSFDMAEIINSRILFLKDKLSSSAFSSRLITGLQLMYDILHDYTPSQLSLGNHLEQMYNCNIRRTFRFLGSVIDNLSKNPRCIEFYQKLWSRVFPKEYVEGAKNITLGVELITRGENTTGAEMNIRRLIRSFIIAKLFCLVNDEHDSINTSRQTTKKHITGLRLAKGGRGPTGKENSYVRRILSILNNLETSEVKFKDFVDSITHLSDPSAKENDNWEDVISVLFYMNNKSWEETGWASLISVETSVEGYYCDSVFRSQMVDNYKVNKEMTISINQSGQNFITNCSTFEYFAWRYVYFQYDYNECGQYLRKGDTVLPLFSISSLLKKKNNRLMLDSIMKETRLKTYSCIMKMIETDEDYFKPEAIDIRNRSFLLTQFNNKQLHAIRVYDRHMGYLESYREYINYLLQLPDEDELIICIADLYPGIDIKSRLSELKNSICKSIYCYRKDVKRLFDRFTSYFDIKLPYIAEFYRKYRINRMK